MFSARTGWDLRPNDLSRAVADRRARGEEILDLTESNPTRCGLGPSPGALREAFAVRGIERYDPDPFGLRSAREAVASYYESRGRIVDPRGIVLTASTSEAYGWLFKLLADPGDRVLVPRPGYPLFHFLGELEHVEVASYPLHREGSRWQVDLDGVRAALDAPGPPVRALVVVSPGNPTGSFLRRAEAAALQEACAARDVALVCDEVFSDFAITTDEEREETLAGEYPAAPALTFVLSGLSKVLALPQVKLGWILAQGPQAKRRQALARLEVIADTYLSVGTPVQVALPTLFAEREAVQAQIGARVRANLETLEGASADGPVSVLRPEGGWQCLLRVPRTRADEAWARSLLESVGVLVQPGYFYDVDEEGLLAASLLLPAAAFAEGARRLVAHVARSVVS